MWVVDQRHKKEPPRCVHSYARPPLPGVLRKGVGAEEMLDFVTLGHRVEQLLLGKVEPGNE